MKAYLISCICILMFLGLQAQETRLIDEINAHEEGIGIWWAGQNGWIIKSGERVISTDILLDHPIRKIPSSISDTELAEILDISFVTHGHGDHFSRSTSAYLAKHSDCIFVLPESCVSIADELNIPAERRRIAIPRESFELEGIKVDAIRAIHGNANFAIYYEANLQDCGYVIDIDGTRFLQPGDSYLLEDHLFLKDIDVLFVSPTEHNMYIDRSVILINTLNPNYIFPQHHSTATVDESSRFWAKGYPDEVKIRLSQEMKDKYHILKQGEGFLIK